MITIVDGSILSIVDLYFLVIPIVAVIIAHFVQLPENKNKNYKKNDRNLIEKRITHLNISRCKFM
jgi:hypothetical protein